MQYAVRIAFSRCYVRFEVFTAVTMMNAVVWDVTLCSSCKNRCFGGTYRLLHQGDKNVVPSSPILVTLMEALSSSETLVLTRATRRDIQEDGVLHSHC
jgi:hypothetical protein